MNWGKNSNGQLGDGTLINRYTPVQVLNLTNIVQVDAGVFHSVAVRGDGTVWCWGARGSGGALGDGLQDGTSPTPVQARFGFFTIVSATPNATATATAMIP